MTPGTIPKEPYNLEPFFEQAVLTLAASHPRFWRKIGVHLDPECLGNVPLAKCVLGAVRLIAKDLGHGPGDPLILLQRLRRQSDEGQVTIEQIQAVSTMIDTVEDGLPNGLSGLDEDEVISELAPVLQRRLQSQAVLAAHDEFARHGDFASVQALVDQAGRIGRKDVVSGSRFGVQSLSVIDSVRNLQRLSTTIMELDLQIDGGPPRGTLSLVIGDYNAGKSMWLTCQAAECMRRGLFVGVATLELSEAYQYARLAAHLTGVPVNDILQTPVGLEEARRRLSLAEAHLGVCRIGEFNPGACGWRELLQWVEEMEREEGIPMDALVIDYADKLSDPQVKDNNTYVLYRHVYEGLRHRIAQPRNMWVWTASQATRPDKDRDKGKRVEGKNVEGSMHKMRVPTLVVTLTPAEEGILYFVDKNTFGKAKCQAGPFAHDFERSRMVPVEREFLDWNVEAALAAVPGEVVPF